MDNFYEHIDDYKNGLLTGEVLDQFEAAMEGDLSLKLAVDNYDAAKGISEGLLEVDMMETLRAISNVEIEEEISNDELRISIKDKNDINHSLPNNDRSEDDFDQSSKKRVKTKTAIFKLRNLMAAASVIGVVFFAGWWVMKAKADNERRVYVLAQIEQKFKPVNPDATKSIREEDSERSDFENGKYYYRLNRYEVSIEWFELMLKEETDQNLRSRGHYWLGHAYIQLWRVEDAKRAWGESGEEEVEKALEMLLK